MTRTIEARRRSLLAGGAALGAALLGPRSARAQDAFPSRTIEVVTHAGVGGGTDITARMMMVQAPGVFRQEFTVVNRTAGSGAQALQYLASKPADGHTIILVTQTHLLTQLRNPNLPQFADLIPVARATADPQLVLVRRDSPFRTPADLVNAGKERSLRFGGTHVGGVDHVTIFAFGRAAGIQRPTLVPFRGGGEIVINLVGGNIDTAVVNPGEAEAQLRAGELRPLISLADTRLAAFRDVPTAKELGIDVTGYTLRGFCVLKGTPEDRVTRLERGLIEAMSGPIYKSYLENTGQAPDSVAGREAWGAQLAQFNRDGREALQALGLLRG
ncbi:Bug family tripartite tricarboxylate transporter substrate binding protein [Neoroseomonas rubea]|uniref:Bug family tripartite tricarboxylate transporter substrate binding protein n=1 Tax=Neoroseomonas rubea TaxID=2748666 RepID=UPI0018E03956|nr:tripartite tricarboxylate transporter substrate binding protein [Roseomonas rubea]